MDTRFIFGRKPRVALIGQMGALTLFHSGLAREPGGRRWHKGIAGREEAHAPTGKRTADRNPGGGLREPSERGFPPPIHERGEKGLTTVG